VGLVQREIEKAGLSTVTLSNIPDLTASLSVPRIAAIEFPFGRTLGNPGEIDVQREVLLGALQVVGSRSSVNRTEPGGIVHLPFEWPEPARETKMDAPVPPPIAGYLKRHPWHLPNLVNRKIPEKAR